MKKLTVFFIIVDIMAAACFVLVYCPIFDHLQNTIISTALITKTHGYIAHIFWSDERIAKVQAADSYTPVDETINLDDIVIDTSPRDSYDNEYDEAILTRDKDNDIYKYLKVKVGDYDGHLVAVYNPANVKLIKCKAFNTGYDGGKESVLKIAKRTGALVGINGGAFADDTGYGSDIPLGAVIKDKEVLWGAGQASELIAMTNDNKLLLTVATPEEAVNNLNVRDALTFGPYLIVNGESIKYNNAAGGYNRAARSAIAQRKDGIILLLATEGTHTAGPNMQDLINTLKLYGAYNAANLDGGTSTQIVIENKLINNPKNVFGQKVEGGRSVVTGWGVFAE